MEIHGKIQHIGMVEQRKETFTVQEVILDISTYEQGTCRKFENYAKFQFCNAHINKLAGFGLGERVKISFNINGKENTTKEGKTYFNQNLNAFKIERI